MRIDRYCGGMGVAATVIAMPVSAQIAIAGQPGTIATARAIIAQMRMERMFDPMFAQLMPLMVGNVINAMRQAADAPPALKARLQTDDGRKEIGQIVSEEFMTAFRARYPEIGEAAAEEYRKSFSEPELKAILAFYTSPAGAKLLDVQPQLQRVLSESGRAIGREAGMAAFPKINARLTALDAAKGK